MAKLTAFGYVKATPDHEPTKTLAKSQIKRCTKIDVTIYLVGLSLSRMTL